MTNPLRPCWAIPAPAICLAATCALFLSAPGATAQTSQSDAPWTVTMTTSPTTLAVGSCSGVFIALKDATGKDTPRAKSGIRVGMSDFDLKASGVGDGAIVGNYDGPGFFTVCACRAASIGSEAKVVATYPAASIVAKGTQVEGVKFESSITVPITAGRGQLEPPGCGPQKTTTLSLTGAPMASATMTATPLSGPVTTPAAAAPAASAAAPATAAGPPIGVGVVRPEEPVPVRPWRGVLTVSGATTPADLISGGSLSGRVVSTGSGSSTDKHLGATAYEPIVVVTNPSPSVVSWINATWAGTAASRAGSVVAHYYESSGSQGASAASSAGGMLAFTNGRIGATRIPSLEAGGHEIDRVTIAIVPEVVSRAAANPTPPGTGSATLIRGFRLTVSGLEVAGVRRIESFVVGAADRPSEVGEMRVTAGESGPAIFPNLFVSFAEAPSPAWIAWYQDFVINGHNGPAQEKTFTLDLLSQNQTTIATIKGYGVGIVALRAGAGGTRTSALQAELYVERMEFVTPTPAAP